MSTVSIERYLDLPADASARGLVLQYGYQPGMTLVYRSRLSTSRKGTSPEQEELEASLTVKVIDQDEADGAFYLIIYCEPRHFVVNGKGAPTSSRSIVYTKQNEYGEAIESTDASGGFTLMLPRMAVAVGSAWNEIDRILPPLRISAVDVVREYRIASIARDTVQITFHAQTVSYNGETQGSEDTECTMGGRGEFLFDARWGLLVRQRLETTMSTSAPGRNQDVKTVHLLELVNS